jgi:hypothetical protein
MSSLFALGPADCFEFPLLAERSPRSPGSIERSPNSHFVVLPDGRQLFLHPAFSTDPSKTAIYIGEFSNSHATLRPSAGTTACTETRLTAVRAKGTLLAPAPFDAAKQVTTADAVPIAEDIDYAAAAASASLCVLPPSEMGMLAYKSSRSQENWQLTLYDRSGKLPRHNRGPGENSIRSVFS